MVTKWPKLCSVVLVNEFRSSTGMDRAAGAILSLQAAAPMQGLALMTIAAQSEFQRLEPFSAEEAIEAQASEYATQNPFALHHMNLT